jgi:DNA-binding CsgD family transcriptional regulator
MRRKKQTRFRAKKVAASSQPRPKFKYEPAEETDSPRLTVREEEVLYWTVRGKENDEIGRILKISPETARKHGEHLRDKFGSESRVAMIAAYWLRQIDQRDRMIAELERKLGQ